MNELHYMLAAVFESFECSVSTITQLSRCYSECCSGFQRLRFADTFGVTTRYFWREPEGAHSRRLWHPPTSCCAVSAVCCLIRCVLLNSAALTTPKTSSCFNHDGGLRVTAERLSEHVKFSYYSQTWECSFPRIVWLPG